jgi:hypothetical protein
MAHRDHHVAPPLRGAREGGMPPTRRHRWGRARGRGEAGGGGGEKDRERGREVRPYKHETCHIFRRGRYLLAGT